LNEGDFFFPKRAKQLQSAETLSIQKGREREIIPLQRRTPTLILSKWSYFAQNDPWEACHLAS